MATTAHPPPTPPRISDVRTGTTVVETSSGPRNATSVEIDGSAFEIRAVLPQVTVGGVLLNHFTIDDSERLISGHLFGGLGSPLVVVVDYGDGLRAEWRGHPGPASSPGDDEGPVDEPGAGPLGRPWPLPLAAILAALGLVLLLFASGPWLMLGWFLAGAAAALALVLILAD